MTSAMYIYSKSTNYPHANIPHFKVIDQDNKQIAIEAGEAFNIRINNTALNQNTVQMYIPEILSILLGAARPSDGSVQMADPDLPQGHIHLTISINRFSRVAYLVNEVAWVSQHTQLVTFISPIGNCQILLNFAHIQN